MELGIIGLPTSGKTTVFNALTGSNRPTATASTGQLEVYSAVVDVPDERVDRLSALFKPRKTTYAKVTYTDIAGLDQGISQSGISGQLRNRIATMDAFVHVIRAFQNDIVAHPMGSVDPQRDLNILDGETILVDLMTTENRLERLAEGLKKGARGEERQTLQEQQELFQRLHETLESHLPLRDLDLTPEEKGFLQGFGLLSLKPMLILLNTGEDLVPAENLVHYEHQQSALTSLPGKLEMEISQLPPDEAEMFMKEFEIPELGSSLVIQKSYDLVGLHSFFTVGEDEVRAWTVRCGANAVDAAGAIHSDLARGFIRAEVIGYPELMAEGNMVAARKAGKVRLEGKEYIVQDGDILHVRFSV